VVDPDITDKLVSGRDRTHLKYMVFHKIMRPSRSFMLTSTIRITTLGTSQDATALVDPPAHSLSLQTLGGAGARLCYHLE